MEIWIPITIFAAFMQNLRSVLQKHLTSQLTTTGATYSRFAFGMPVAFIYLVGLWLVFGYSIPMPDERFYVYVLLAGGAQIIATALLVYIFSLRNFVTGTTLSKTETVQTAIFSLFILGEFVSSGAIFGILISLIGVIMIAITRATLRVTDLFNQFKEPAAILGIASGAFFGISAVSVRAASLSLESGDFVIRAALTLAAVTIFQTIIMSVYMRIREPGQISVVLKNWRIPALVGLAGVLGSIGWFSAMTLQNAAYVRALGQVELLFTIFASYFIFREKISRSEIGGVIFVTLGILLLVLSD